MQVVTTISRGKKAVEINDKDLEHITRLVGADVRYLSGKGAPRDGGDANATKLKKRRELLEKLETLKKK